MKTTKPLLWKKDSEKSKELKHAVFPVKHKHVHLWSLSNTGGSCWFLCPVWVRRAIFKTQKQKNHQSVSNGPLCAQCYCYWHVLRSERKVVNWNTEMKRASTLQWCLVVSGPLSCFTCWPWSISCNCFICTPHMSLSGVWGSYRLQSITKLSRWSQWQSNEDHIVLSILHNCDIVMSSQEADPVRAIFGGGGG